MVYLLQSQINGYLKQFSKFLLVATPQIKTPALPLYIATLAFHDETP
jgi:hypothetical protein